MYKLYVLPKEDMDYPLLHNDFFFSITAFEMIYNDLGLIHV